jgi:4-amino-4-deoxy-L-arabinose transferase-like glycosyltransferase
MSPRRCTPLLLLIGYASLLFFYGLGDRDLTSSHEARAAQNAQNLLTDGAWLVPRLFDRQLELQKPPLYYWLVGALAWLRGGAVDVWAVRLPSAFAALGCVLFLYYLGLRRGRPVAGFVAALVLASGVHFTWLARVGRIDMPLTFAVTLALGCFALARDSERRRLWCWLGYTALALGVLLKGPIAIVLVALVAAVYCLAEGRPRWSEWRRSSLWWGVPWLLLLTAPWFIAANLRTGGRLWDVFFWHHNFERGLGGSDTLAAHAWWFYLPRAGVDLLPWSLGVPVAVWWYWRMAEPDRDARAGLLWFTSIFAFLSCMSFKRADYLLPAYPGLAIFLGAVAENVLARGANRARNAKVLAGGFALLLVMYALAWGGHNAWVAREDQDWPYQRLAREIRQQTRRAVVFFRAEEHLLAFHVGRPIETIVEWENLAIWAEVDFRVYFIMPEECARELPRHLPGGALTEVMRTSAHVRGQRDHCLVVLRNRGKAPPGP